jgi:hypothetical protein
MAWEGGGTRGGRLARLPVRPSPKLTLRGPSGPLGDALTKNPHFLPCGEGKWNGKEHWTDGSQRSIHELRVGFRLELWQRSVCLSDGANRDSGRTFQRVEPVQPRLMPQLLGTVRFVSALSR